MRRTSNRWSNHEQRFWSNVDIKGAEECWIWKAAHTPKGYGRFGWKHQNSYAHRFSYELHHGRVPEGMDVCHRCDNPRCANPAHLFAGNRKDNMQDAIKKGRPVGYWTQKRSVIQNHKPKEVCLRGHLKSGSNLYVNPLTGQRACRQCVNISKRAHRARKRIEIGMFEVRA